MRLFAPLLLTECEASSWLVWPLFKPLPLLTAKLSLLLALIALVVRPALPLEIARALLRSIERRRFGDSMSSLLSLKSIEEVGESRCTLGRVFGEGVGCEEAEFGVGGLLLLF